MNMREPKGEDIPSISSCEECNRVGWIYCMSDNEATDSGIRALDVAATYQAFHLHRMFSWIVVSSVQQKDCESAYCITIALDGLCK